MKDNKTWKSLLFKFREFDYGEDGKVLKNTLANTHADEGKRIQTELI